MFQKLYEVSLAVDASDGVYDRADIQAAESRLQKSLGDNGWVYSHPEVDGRFHVPKCLVVAPRGHADEVEYRLECSDDVALYQDNIHPAVGGETSAAIVWYSGSDTIATA